MHLLHPQCHVVHGLITLVLTTTADLLSKSSCFCSKAYMLCLLGPTGVFLDMPLLQAATCRLLQHAIDAVHSVQQSVLPKFSTHDGCLHVWDAHMGAMHTAHCCTYRPQKEQAVKYLKLLFIDLVHASYAR